MTKKYSLNFLKHLTLAEVHSFTVGYSVGYIAGETSEKQLLTHLSRVAIGIEERENKKLKYVIEEPHYFLIGATFGYIHSKIRR